MNEVWASIALLCLTGITLFITFDLLEEAAARWLTTSNYTKERPWYVRLVLWWKKH